MKIIACILFLLSALWIGLEIAKSQRERLTLIKNLVRTTEYMHTELNAKPCAIDELCDKASAINEGQIKCFLISVCQEMNSIGQQSFKETWRVCCMDKLNALGKDELGAMLELGDTLGAYDLAAQLKAINICATKLMEIYQTHKERYNNNKKLYIALPCSVACMILMLIV